jgi:hypothetical protein
MYFFDAIFFLQKKKLGIFQKKMKMKRRNIEMEVDLFRSKIQDALDQGITIHVKPNCELIGNKLFMKCIRCNQLKERTTEHFHQRNKGKNFLTSLAGDEHLENSSTKPCIQCVREVSQELHSFEGVHVFSLVSHYRQDGITEEWMWETLKTQRNVGPISGQILKFGTSEKRVVGIHKYDNSKEHIPSNCFLEFQDMNVSQHKAIPCLFCAWKDLYTRLLDQFVNPYIDNSQHLLDMRLQYKMTIKDLGILYNKHNRQMYELQVQNRVFPRILRHAIQYHISEDIVKKRFKLPTNISRTQFVDIVFKNSLNLLDEQSWKCAYSHVNMTIENIWTRFSFERINDKISHFTESGKVSNIVFICRLLNTSEKLSRMKLLDNLLHQNLVEIPNTIRMQINPNSSENWVAPLIWNQQEIDLLEFTPYVISKDSLLCNKCQLFNNVNK